MLPLQTHRIRPAFVSQHFEIRGSVDSEIFDHFHDYITTLWGPIKHKEPVATIVIEGHMDLTTLWSHPSATGHIFCCGTQHYWIGSNKKCACVKHQPAT